MRLIVGMTGATGSIYGLRLLEALRDRDDVETHLILSRWGRTTVSLETGLDATAVAELADVVHDPADRGASVASGSFRTDGMIVLPCSMRTLAGIRAGYDDGLMGRAAEVVLKERKPLVLGVRETPLSPIHLENMLALARLGVIIAPPAPAFYHRPESIDELVDHYVARVLDQIGIDVSGARRWSGIADARRG